MANDREVLREIWDGKLPVRFMLHDEEVHDLQAPEPYYLMVPRLSYFPLVWDKVRKHFSKHVHPDKQESEMWLDFNGTPLRWHYPVGLLFDLYAYDTQLPWSLTVHFDKFPEDEIIHCASRDVVKSHFMSTIKEADALKHRSQVISIMQEKEHTQLWLGLQNDKFDQFWAVNKKLMDTSSNEGEFKHIPFRLYTTDDAPFVQKLIKPYNEDKQQKVLSNLIQEIYPSNYDKMKVIIHGIDIPLDTPIQWLSEHLSYPDNFLHFCVVSNP
ncbi:autophagy protein 5 [Planococcus citri]|uniref:autophagy protein 5 n=1 Tax=Planococcus citri TaxID=170843 RepID=UPI0031F7A215